MKRIEFYEKRKIFGIISAAIVAIGLLCTFIFGVQLDIQFKGGSFLSYNYEGSIDLNAVEGVAEEVLKTDVSVTTTTDPTGATIFKISTADKVSVDENEALDKALAENAAALREELGRVVYLVSCDCIIRRCSSSPFARFSSK